MATGSWSFPAGNHRFYCNVGRHHRRDGNSRFESYCPNGVVGIVADLDMSTPEYLESFFSGSRSLVYRNGPVDLHAQLNLQGFCARSFVPKGARRRAAPRFLACSSLLRPRSIAWPHMNYFTLFDFARPTRFPEGEL